MSDEERTRWNRCYTDSDDTPHHVNPSPFLETWLEHLPGGGRALDVACGRGRNALLLAEAGYRVEAVDISTVAIARARSEARRQDLTVIWHMADLDDYIPEDGAYQVITVIRYRNRALWPRLIDALAPDGWILIEHHFKTSRPVAGPSEAFKLDPQELLDAFGTLRVVFFEEVIERDPDRPERTVALERTVACKGDPGF